MRKITLYTILALSILINSGCAYSPKRRLFEDIIFFSVNMATNPVGTAATCSAVTVGTIAAIGAKDVLTNGMDNKNAKHKNDQQQPKTIKKGEADETHNKVQE